MRISIVFERKDPVTGDYWEEKDPYEPEDNPHEHWFSFHKWINTRRTRKMLKMLHEQPVSLHALDIPVEELRPGAWWDRAQDLRKEEAV